MISFCPSLTHQTCVSADLTQGLLPIRYRLHHKPGLTGEAHPNDNLSMHVKFDFSTTERVPLDFKHITQQC